MSSDLLLCHASKLQIFLQWYTDHWLLALILLTFLGWAVTFPLQLIFHCYRARQRRIILTSQGWPPPHIDVDGTFKKEEQ